MVTYDDVYALIARRPFRPFWLALTSGERIEIYRRNQAVAMRTRVMVVTREDRLRPVALTEIVRLEEGASADAT